MKLAPRSSVLFVSLPLLYACGPSANGGSVKGGGGEQSACVSLEPDAPELLPPETHAVPLSRLVLRANVPVDSLMDQVEAQIPLVLAKEKDRDVGAPGRASFQVTRGRPSLRSSGNKLLLDVPLSLDISVCKPIGSGCLRYGRCAPKLLTTFAFETTPKNFELKAPKGSVIATKKCQIGLDVTEHILAAAKQEVRKVEKDVAQRWPVLRPQIIATYESLATPLPEPRLPEPQLPEPPSTEGAALAKETCYYIAPASLEYQAPHLVSRATGVGDQAKKKDFLVATLTTSGTLTRAPSCSAPQTLPPLPELTVRADAEETSAVWVPEYLSNDDLKAALAQSTHGVDGAQIVDLRQGKDSVAFLVKAPSLSCKPGWVTARWVVREDGFLGVRDISFKNSDSDAKDESSNSVNQHDLARSLTENVRVPLRLTAASLQTYKMALDGEIKSVLPEGAQVSLGKVKQHPPQLSTTPEGLTIYQHIEFSPELLDL